MSKRKNINLSNAFSRSLGIALTAATRAMIDVLEVVEEESERLANTPVRRSPPPSSGSRTSRRASATRVWDQEAQNAMLIALDARLLEKRCRFCFQKTMDALGLRKHSVEIELRPNARVHCVYYKDNTLVYRGSGFWHSYGPELESGGGLRIDLDEFPEDLEGTLWIEADKHTADQLVVTITHGMFDLVNAFDLYKA